MQFRILGPLEVRGAEGPLSLGGPKQRALLALLLLHANETVSTDALIDGLWGERAPQSAANALQVYISGLRKLLGADVLVTKPPGYELRLDPDDFDLIRFERGLAEAYDILHGGDLAAASDAFDRALTLWHGRPLVGLELGVEHEAEASRLEELRLAALEDRCDADLELGRHTALTAELESLVTEHPDRERLAGQLMVALYRSGRQAEALEAYRTTRTRLVEELGLEPSPALQQLEQQILAQDPNLLREPAAATAEAKEPARRRVVVLAAELEAAFDGDSFDPEAEERALAPALADAAGVLERHGAAVERSGWRLRGIFGLPQVREDDALRAAAAALELRNLGEEIERRGATPVIRMGISAGEVVSGAAGSTGRPLRDAEDLARAAGPGEILVGERARRLMPGAELTDDQAGRRRLHSLDRDAEAIPRRHDLAIVGRRRELRVLEQAFAQVLADERCGVAVVVGPPGIGKSRLTRELAARAAAQATAVTSRSRSHGQGATFLPLAEIVHELSGTDIAGGLQQLLRGEKQKALVVERLEVAFGLGEGEGSREQTFWAVRRLLEAVARRRPLVVRLEDLHWADDALLDLVDYLRQWLRDAPVLLVATGRPELLERRPEWRTAADGLTAVQLEPLADREASRMIGALLGSRSEALRARIAAAAEGNPLFIEQIVAMLEEAPEADELAVPPTIQALLAARLDLLGRPERRLAERAAVIGREFAAETAARLAAIEAGEAEQLLQRLCDRQLVEEAEPGRFRFRHQLIAESAYEVIPKLERADLHEQVAGELETDEAIGYHLERAYRYRDELAPDDDGDALMELGRKASGYLADAGLAAHSRGDASAAAALMSSALELPRGLDNSADAELLLALSAATRESGDLARATTLVDYAVEAARRAGRPDLITEARILDLRLRIGTAPPTPDALTEAAAQAITEFEELGDDAGLSKAWFLVAWAHWLRCRVTDAEAALEHSVAHARAAGDEPSYGLARGLMLGAAVFGALPVADGIARCEAALAEPHVPRRVEASAHRALGGLRAMAGDFDAARSSLTRDSELLEEAGLVIASTASAEIRGMVELLAGRFDAAEARFRAGLEIVPEERSAWSTLAGWTADAVHEQGRYEEAVELTRASEEAAAKDDVSDQVHWRRVRAKALARGGGDAAPAAELAAEAVRLVAGTEFLNMEGGAHFDAAETLDALGRRAEAREHLELALAAFERKGNLAFAARVRAVLKGDQRAGVTRAASGRRRSSKSAAAPAAAHAKTSPGKSADGEAPSTTPAASGPTANPTANELVDNAM